jgi:uncharacterized protein YlxW (UPF0749 family)
MPDESPDALPPAEKPTSGSPDPSAPGSGGTDTPTPRRTLASMLLGRPSGAQIVVALLLAALGFAAVVQVRLTRTDDFGGARRDDLVELLDSLSGASDRAQQQIDDLQQTRANLLTSSQSRQAAIKESQDRLGVLQILAGSVGAVGPGIVVTIQDPNDAMTPASLLDGVEELRDAGAEAIQINGRVRVVASTSFVDAGGVLTADGTALSPPYVIDAIGSSHTLSQAVVFPGGLSDQVDQLGGQVDVKEADVVEVSALHTIKPPEYSQPTGR